MNKAIIIILLVIRTIITPFCNLAGRGTKTVNMNERAQLGLTGIYITVLSYKEIRPIMEDKYYKKYIAFEVLLDGSKEKTGGHFGHNVSCDSVDCYDTCGNFYLDGKIDGSGIRQHSLSPPEILSLFGKDHPPVIGMGKIGEEKKVTGYIIFGLPENFKFNKFVYQYHEYSDLRQILLPEAKIQIIFEKTIN